MNAEEFKAVVERAKRVTEELRARHGITNNQVILLYDVVRDLDQHWREMVKGETDDLETPVASHDNTNFDHSGRLDAIEKRLRTQVGRVDNLSNEGSDLARQVDAIERRLNEMPAYFRKAITAHFYDQTKRLEGVERKADDTRDAYVAHIESIHRDFSVFSDVKPLPASEQVRSVEVEMRLDGHTHGGSTWQCCLMGIWVTAHRYSDNANAYLTFAEAMPARESGNNWLAALGNEFDVTLIPKWVTDTQPADAG